MSILMSINNNIYDLSEYKHPGEGIKNIYLRHYKGKECTEEFEREHFTEVPDELLINAKENGYNSEAKIYYVCPWFFKRKIPKYFHFLKDDIYGINFMKNKQNCSFVLRPSNSDPLNSLSLTYKNEKGKLNQLKITKVDNNWYTNWEDSSGEPIDISDKYIENIIKKIMLDNNYTYLL